MKKFFTIKTLALALTLSVAGAVPVFAQTTGDTQDKVTKKERRAGMMRRAGRHHRGGRMGMAAFRQLDLTEAQKAQIKQIRASHRESLKALKQQIRAKRQELRQLNQNGAFNEQLASQKIAELAPLQAKVMGEKFRIRQETLAVLTPEQKTKLEQLKEQFKTRIKERRANRTTNRG
jgi:periplasmic protein CpxP/Spy